MRGEPFERTIPVGSSAPPGPVAFDVSGRHIATLLPVPGQDLDILYAGIPQDAAIIATDVTGYAWHDAAPSQLSYTNQVDGELLLWRMSHNRADPELVARSVAIEGGLAAWGEWGYAIQDGAGVVLLTETGAIKDIHPGRVLDSDGTGWLAIDNDGVSLLSAGGGVRGLDREGLGGEVRAARFSSDGRQLALLTVDGALVLSLEDDSELMSAGGRPGVPVLAWSSDGRFVLYPAAVRGLQVIDTGSGDTEEILGTRTLTGVGILPLSSA